MAAPAGVPRHDRRRGARGGEGGRRAPSRGAPWRRSPPRTGASRSRPRRRTGDLKLMAPARGRAASVDVERRAAAAALDGDGHRLARVAVLDRRRDVVGRAHGRAADGDDHVAGAQAGLLGGPARGEVADHRAGVAAGRRRHAEVGAPDRLAALQAGDHVADGVGGHGEADPDVAVAAPARLDLRVDADHPPVRVEQRPARVAGVDRRVGLDHRVDLEAVGRLDVAAGARHDPRRGGLREPERRADRDRELARSAPCSSPRARVRAAARSAPCRP